MPPKKKAIPKTKRATTARAATKKPATAKPRAATKKAAKKPAAKRPARRTAPKAAPKQQRVREEAPRYQMPPREEAPRFEMPREEPRQEEPPPVSHFQPGFAPECMACPIGLVFFAMKNTKPEVMDHLMKAGFEVFQAFRALTEQYNDRWEQARTLQRIPIS